MALYTVYWLISEDFSQTYVGFSDNVGRRIGEHKNKEVKTTQNFGRFKCFKLEEVGSEEEAIKRERYWKSAAGRKKLIKYFEKIKNSMPLSSRG